MLARKLRSVAVLLICTSIHAYIYYQLWSTADLTFHILVLVVRRAAEWSQLVSWLSVVRT